MICPRYGHSPLTPRYSVLSYVLTAVSTWLLNRDRASPEVCPASYPSDTCLVTISALYTGIRLNRLYLQQGQMPKGRLFVLHTNQGQSEITSQKTSR
jgi:hypothetical protein